MKERRMSGFAITGGQVLIDGAFRTDDVLLQDGLIAADAAPRRRLDAAGLLVLPGIVDLHGDAFERQVQPRPGVAFRHDLALAETERQLLGCGITTAFHSVTLSWEPGLRSAAAWRLLLDALQEGRDRFVCDMRVHLRWEAFNLDALDMAIDDIAQGRVHLLAFNDHTASIIEKIGKPSGAKYAERAGMNIAAFTALARSIAERAAEVPAALDRIAAAARARALPMASHDDDSIAMRESFAARGARISEFPVTEDVARFARSRSDATVMGSPNVVRGGSHLGWVSAADMAERGLCTVLVSDYYYPCLLTAPFTLADRDVLSLAQAWALVSENPARAANLADRGRIAPALRGDLVVIEPDTRLPVATFAHGRLAWLSAAGADRLH
jgi:alpha-D-ribose 1-methylphosphonate 5-triphosphate diphosphatase